METDNSVNFEPALDKNKFVLYTNQTCFLCLNYKFINQQNELSLRPHSLLSICRYLKIDVKKFLEHNLKEVGSQSGNDFLKEKVANLTVGFCNNCSSVTSKLSDLCQELEVLQMKVNHCLQSFQNELENSEMDNFRVERFRQMKLGRLESEDVKLAEILRKKIRKQCDMKVNSFLPKVIIKGRIQEQSKQISPKTYSVLPESYHGTSELADSFDAELETEDSDNYDDNIPSPSPKEETKSHSKTKSSLNRGRQDKPKICTICQPPMLVRDGRLHYHNIRVHIDHLLINSKLPYTSSDDFKIYANHVHKVEIISSKKGVDSTGRPICNCPHCSSTYATYEKLKLHIFIEHKNILAKKLIALQKSSTVDDIQSIKLPPMSMSGTLNCDKCGRTFTFKNAFNRHKMYSCKFGPTMKSPHFDGQRIPQKCEKCGVVCSAKNSLWRHKKFSCKFGPIKMKVYENENRKCRICKKTFRFPKELEIHQNRVHHRYPGLDFTEVKANSTKKQKDHHIETPIADAEMVDAGHHEYISYHSINLKFNKEGKGNTDEMEEYDKDEENTKNQQQMDVDIGEHDCFVVKTEQFNVSSNVDVIIPDEEDPLQL